jgi:hypothetical protein
MFRRNIITSIFRVGASCYLLPAGFLLGLFFDLEDGGDMFLQNVGYFQRTTRHYIPEARTLRSYYFVSEFA